MSPRPVSRRFTACGVSDLFSSLSESGATRIERALPVSHRRRRSQGIVRCPAVMRWQALSFQLVENRSTDRCVRRQS